jgi:hypothetical protein
MKACLGDISAWMKSNILKFNQDKTELIIFTTKCLLHICPIGFENMQYFFGPSTDPCGTPNDRIFSVDTI